MSFDDLVKSDYALKEKVFTVSIGEKKYTFKAVQPAYTERLSIEVAKHRGGDFFLELVLKTIVDQDGNRMSEEQAKKLPDEVMAKFVNEAVSILGDEKDKVKKKPKRK